MAQLKDRDEKVIIADNEDNELISVDDTGKLLVSGEIELDGSLNHDGTTVGFYGVAPTARPAAYTQTYATADKTLAAPPAAITGGEAPTEAEHNAVITALTDAMQMLNAVIDDLQLQGLLQ